MASTESSIEAPVNQRSADVFDPRVITDADRHDLSHHVSHLAHMLSEQGPMSVTFVHNNTLLGLQDMHFEKAIAKAESFMGGRGFLDNQAYRDYYAKGRISDDDIRTALASRDGLTLDKVLAETGEGPIDSGKLYFLNMLHGFDAISPERLGDLMRATDSFDRLDEGLAETARTRLLEAAKADAEEVGSINNSDALAAWLDSALGLDLMLSSHPQRDDEALRSEVDGALRDLFDIDGTPAALSDYITANPERWAARRQWGAVLGQLGLSTPTVDGLETSADQALRDQRQLELAGGAEIPIDGDTRALITEIVSAEIDAIDSIEDRTSVEVGRARVAWNILHGLTVNSQGHSLDRQGYNALTTLLTQRNVTSGAEANLAETLRRADPQGQMIRHAEDRLTADLMALQAGENHADFIERMTGENIINRVNEYMIGVCASFLDEGLAAWHMPSRATGFFDAWRNLVRDDRTFDFDGVTDWRASVDRLPLQATDAVISQLVELGVSQDGWADYCGRALTHLKGWAGMIFWRQENGGYDRQQAQPIDLMQYLAVRLFYQNLLISKTCSSHWKLQPDMQNLQAYFGSNLPEYFVRRELFAGKLSDGLAQQARALVGAANSGRDMSERWQTLATMSWAERARDNEARAVADDGWRLYRLTQHLAMKPTEIRDMSDAQRDQLVGALNEFSGKDHGPLWLLAFEKNYRDEICNALALNRGKGRWLSRDERPKSQVVFCIDEREESIHRHYEELDPGHETFGAAGFFGVAIDYQALDDHGITPLCPAPVTPAHRVLEVPRPKHQGRRIRKHNRRAKWAEVFHDTYWEMKRNPVSSYFLIDVTGLLMAIPLIGRIFFPLKYFSGMDLLGRAFVPKVATQLAVGRSDDDIPEGSVADGFTVDEQADRVEGLLRNIGLLEKFAPIVVICAHGSHSENNPHENAHDCGACGGKNGAPNSRAVAVMANNPDVRAKLVDKNIVIPDDTWFVGAIHNTASEIVTMLDETDIPSRFEAQYGAVKRDMDEAVKRAARERCRRFASAPKDASLNASLHHTKSRALDFSQVRPEWGHATNACAVVGRRALTQGVFFDRRSFIISYDPSTDPEGLVLERILLAVGPVGAGINLEYYFSTVDPLVYGCDTKVPHNVTGLVGVMEGAHSDLRTGLPRQMTEVHEAMRLHLIVDASPTIAGEIYGRQPGIQQLLDNEWVLLIVHDPDTEELLRFVPGVGFEKWDDSHLTEIPQVDESYDWYRGKYQCFLPPARITEPTASWQNGG